jgi:transmembrane sensor
MTPPETSLGRHIVPSLDEARLDRQVAGIAERVSARRPLASRRFLTVAAAAACVGVVAIVALRSRVPPRPPSEPGVMAGTTFEAPAGGETITLGDGSRAVLDPRSKLTLLTVRPELVRVALERGGVDLDVVHAEGKQFVALARGYEIRVLGTRFRVRLGEAAGAPALEITVARGRVRVTRVGESGADNAREADVRVLDAGETWSTAPNVAAAPAPEAEATPPLRPKPTAGSELGESARDLLARAEAFRAANDPRAAARLFDALRLRHRSDPRAGLAAFELGRLRLDRLGDPRGAAEAFNDAISVAPDAPFREDAQARLVEAYAASRDSSRCLEAQAVYLLRYPRGVHRAKVAARCPE